MFCLLTWALGLLMKISFVADLRKKLEDRILNFVPALNHHKILVAENTDAGKSQDTWKPVLVLMNVRYKSAFVVEAEQELITLFICRANSLKAGEVVSMKKGYLLYS